jgi:hypothetical protein
MQREKRGKKKKEKKGYEKKARLKVYLPLVFLVAGPPALAIEPTSRFFGTLDLVLDEGVCFFLFQIPNGLIRFSFFGSVPEGISS